MKKLFDLAVQNHQKNNLQVAENLYKETLKTNPNHVDAHNNLGISFNELDDCQKAKSCLVVTMNQSQKELIEDELRLRSNTEKIIEVAKENFSEIKIIKTTIYFKTLFLFTLILSSKNIKRKIRKINGTY